MFKEKSCCSIDTRAARKKWKCARFQEDMSIYDDDPEKTALQIVEERDLRQITNLEEIEAICLGIVQDPHHASQVRLLID